MLILSRKINERILIGEDVYLSVLGVNGNQVRLGFKAPEFINIVREELLGRDLKSTKFWEGLLTRQQRKNYEPFVNQ